MGEHSFPVLSPDDCVSFFRDITNISISEEDFKKPDVRRWQIFYGTIFELMTGRQADLITQNYLQTHLHAAADWEYHELQEESFTLMTFTMSLQKILSAAGVFDFTVRDLLEPRPKRLLRIVSGAINFIRFKIFREGVFNQKKEDLEKQRESYDYVLKENAERKRALQAKREAHQLQMAKVKQLQDENDAISVRIQDQHKQREVSHRGLSEKKNELTQRNASNDQVKVNILAAQAEGEKLSQRIVQSPERVKAETERGKNRIMALKSTQEEKQTRLGEVQRQREAVAQQEQDAQQAVRLMTDISNDSSRLAELEKAIRQQQDAHQDLRSSSLGMIAKRDHLRQVLASRQDKLSKLDLQYNNKKAALQEHISQLSHSKETLHDPRGSSESKKSELLTEMEQVKGEVADKELELEGKVERANNLYFEILQQVDNINVAVANGFGEFKTTMKKC